MSTETAAATQRGATLAGWLGIVGVLWAAGVCLWLDISTGADWYRSTISGYVFTHPVTFTSAVAALVVGSVAIHSGLIRRGVIRAWWPTSVLLGLWSLGMLGVAIFPKHNWSEGPSLSGHIHRVTSLVAFFALPLAVLLLTRHALRHADAWMPRIAAGLAIASLGYLGYLGWTIVQASADGVRWWRAVPLGLSERILLGLEVAALAAVAVWLLARPLTPQPEADALAPAGDSRS